MDHTNDMLIKEAIKKLENLDELLKSCAETINSAYAEMETSRYLFWLGCEKEEKKKMPRGEEK